MKGSKPKSTLLKLIAGEVKPYRLHDDKPKNPNPPEPPPGCVLNDAERRMFEWLLENVAVKNVHGVADGAAFVKIARLWVRVQEADAQLETEGLLMYNPKTKRPELRPLTRLSRDLWYQIGSALSEIGATPSGRVRLAGPLVPPGREGGADWTEGEP